MKGCHPLSYSGLFTPEGWPVPLLRSGVYGVQSLPAPAQCLFLRLFQRKRHWFRIPTLSYSEVPNTSEAVEALTAAGFARTSDIPSMQGMLCILFSFSKQS